MKRINRDGRRLRDRRQQPLGQRAAGADHRRDLGVAQQVGEIVAGAGGVGRDRDARRPSGSRGRPRTIPAGSRPGSAPARRAARPSAARQRASELRLVPARGASSTADRRRRALAHRNGRSPRLGGRPLEHGHEVGAEIGHGHRCVQAPRAGAAAWPPWRRRRCTVRAMLEARPQRPISRGLRNKGNGMAMRGAGAAADEGERGGRGQPVAGRAGAGLEPGRPLPIGSTIRASRPTSRRSRPTPRRWRPSSRAVCRSSTATASPA